jgi:hypothetical protein
MGVGEVSDTRWTARFPGFAAFSTIPPGSVSPSDFKLSIDVPPLPSQRRCHLFAEVAGEPPAPLGIVEEPRLSGGMLTVTLSASQTLLSRFFDRRLDLLVVVGQCSILLGSWSMSDWLGGEKTFRIPLPGAGSGRVECGSVLQARLVYER